MERHSVPTADGPEAGRIGDASGSDGTRVRWTSGLTHAVRLTLSRVSVWSVSLRGAAPFASARSGSLHRPRRRPRDRVRVNGLAWNARGPSRGGATLSQQNAPGASPRGPPIDSAGPKLRPRRPVDYFRSPSWNRRDVSAGAGADWSARRLREGAGKGGGRETGCQQGAEGRASRRRSNSGVWNAGMPGSVPPRVHVVLCPVAQFSERESEIKNQRREREGS